jgi:hypothetical protein
MPERRIAFRVVAGDATLRDVVGNDAQPTNPSVDAVVCTPSF